MTPNRYEDVAPVAAAVAHAPPARTRSSAGALAVLCTAQFVLQLDFSIVNVALPSIQRSLGLAPADLQWVITGYALTFGSLLLAGGRAADLLGRRHLLIRGLLLFAAASLAAGLAQSPVMLVAARLIQGAAGAMVSPAALSLLTTTHAEGPERNRALGLWQAATAGGATTAIVVGGALTQWLGWRAIFLVNPPVIAVMLPIALRVLPVQPPAGGVRPDLRGALLATSTLAALIYGVSNGQQHGFASTGTVVALIFASALAVAFLVTERSVGEPMLPFAMFSVPMRRAAVGVMLAMGAIMAGYVYFLSMYLQRVEGYGPMLTGVALVPSAGTVVVISTFFTRRMLASWGVKPTLVGGLMFAAAGQLWLSRITPGGSYLAGVLPGLLLMAVGMALVLATASVAITSGLHGRDQGMAGGLFVTGQQLGAAVGLAALAAIAAARSDQAHHALIAGYKLSFLLAGLLALLAAGGVTLYLTQSSRKAIANASHDSATPPGGAAATEADVSD